VETNSQPVNMIMKRTIKNPIEIVIYFVMSIYRYGYYIYITDYFILFVSCYFNQKLQNVVFQQSRDVNLVATIILTTTPNTNLVCVCFM
jgi:hypothetical protein